MWDPPTPPPSKITRWSLALPFSEGRSRLLQRSIVIRPLGLAGQCQCLLELFDPLSGPAGNSPSWRAMLCYPIVPYPTLPYNAAMRGGEYAPVFITKDRYHKRQTS